MSIDPLNRNSYISKYSGEEIDEAVRIIKLIKSYYSYGKKLESDVTLPVDLNSIIEPGNYTVNYFLNGSTSMSKYSPINLLVYIKDGLTYQSVYAGTSVFTRYRTSIDTFSVWNEVIISDISNDDTLTKSPLIEFNNETQSGTKIMTIPAGTYISQCMIEVIIKFDDPNSVLSIGTIDEHEYLVSTTDVDLSDDSLYSLHCGKYFESDTDIYLYIGGVSTSGSGNIKIIIN